MNFSRWVASALLAATGALAAAPEARAADPVVLGVSEAETPDTGDRVLVVYGLLMTKVKTWELRESGGTTIAPLTILFKSKNFATLALPTDLADTHAVPGPFLLHYTFGRTGIGDVDINITGGAPALGSVSTAVLDPALLIDLNDADTVGGESPAVLHDWNNLTNVPPDFADGVDNSVALAGNGMATTASRSDHDHDLRYFTETELNTGDGTVNQAGDPIDWTRIKGIPAGFADGVDDGGAGSSYTAGSGLLLTTTVFSADFTTSGGDAGTDTKVARGNHLHDGRYYTESELNGAGTINTGSNPVDWTKLKNVPAAFADGTDDGASLTAGNGILISSGVVSANFGGSGSATTVARSDHTHTGFLATSGGTLSGTLTINASGSAVLATSGSTSTTTGGIDCTTSGGIAFVGHGDVGVYGDCDSSGGITGVHGASLQGGYYQVGVYGYAFENSSSAMYAYHYYGGYALDAHSWNGTAIRARTSNLQGGDIVSVQGYTGNGYNTGVRVTMNGYGNTALRGYTYGSYGRGALISAYGYRSLGAYIGARGNYCRGMYLNQYGYRGTGFYQSTGGYRSRGTVLYHNGTYSTAQFIRGSGYGSSSLWVNHYGSGYGNVALFQYYGKSVFRITKHRSYFNGYNYSSGADFAESVKVDTKSSEFEPGDVVVIDVDAVRQFSLSTEANSPLVAGVISTKAALIGTTHDLSVYSEEKRALRKATEVHLGIVGIVPTKVCDEGGAIRAGDLLVTASIPGHARKAPANPAPGTILGKALAPHGKGQGKIEVLLISR